jgi:hypothetical protein
VIESAFVSMIVVGFCPEVDCIVPEESAYEYFTLLPTPPDQVTTICPATVEVALILVIGVAYKFD